MSKPTLPVVLFFLLVIVLFDRQFAHADCRFFSKLMNNGSYGVADAQGRTVSSCNLDTPFIPASIIKIPLALAALDILGREFRFITELYMDQEQNLYIRGDGDPFMISEEVALILDQLVQREVRIINGIFIDTSAYDLERQVPGINKSDNPYDVPISPVTVNFNTVNIRVSAQGRVESAEEQTPSLPIMQDVGRSFSAGEYRVNVCQGDCSPQEQSARYTGELFRSLQRKKGIVGDGPVGVRQIPEGEIPIYVHRNTRNLEEVVFSFLKYSNNLVANQVFLRCGIEKFGEPATWEKAARAVKQTLAKLLGPEITSQIRMEEGAGISRDNRVTASAMLQVLNKFKPYANLLQEKNGAAVKSGTLQGVYNYAGYLQQTWPFVILLNQRDNSRDKIMKELTRQLEKTEGYEKPE